VVADALLRKPTTGIACCCADAIAASASDEQTKAALLEIAKRWLDIALTYESGEQSIRLRKKRWQGGPSPVCDSAQHENAPPQVTHE